MHEQNSTTNLKRFGYREIYFYPPMECSRCHRLTTVAVLNPDQANPFTPGCPIHSLVELSGPSGTEPTQEQLEPQYSAVRRFILWMHADQGRVPLVSRIQNVKTIPGYELDEDEETEFNDLGWSACYEAPDGARVDAWVVFSIDEWQYYLYENGTLVTERQSEEVV